MKEEDKQEVKGEDKKDNGEAKEERGGEEWPIILNMEWYPFRYLFLFILLSFFVYLYTLTKEKIYVYRSARVEAQRVEEATAEGSKVCGPLPNRSRQVNHCSRYFTFLFTSLFFPSLFFSDSI